MSKPLNQRRKEGKVITEWLYFGCGNAPGHYLFTAGGDHQWKALRQIARFDGLLAPQDSDEECVASLSRLEAWSASALAWWDRSVDVRRGANSIAFAPSLTITREQMLAEAEARFPWVFQRLRKPVRFMGQSVGRQTQDEKKAAESAA